MCGCLASLCDSMCAYFVCFVGKIQGMCIEILMCVCVSKERFYCEFCVFVFKSNVICLCKGWCVFMCVIVVSSLC